MPTIFQRILATRSLTCIHYLTETDCDSAKGPEKDALRRINETNKLDEA